MRYRRGSNDRVAQFDEMMSKGKQMSSERREIGDAGSGFVTQGSICRASFKIIVKCVTAAVEAEQP